MKTCGKCGAAIPNPGPCPVCNDSPYGRIDWSGTASGRASAAAPVEEPVQPGSMLALLASLEPQLHDLLHDRKRWTGMLIDYEQPVVERLYTQVGENRLSVHRIHPCERAFFHPHPWPSAVWLIDGKYEMAVGHGVGGVPPSAEDMRLVIMPGTRYEMTSPNGWHYVRPLDKPSKSIMVTGKPWAPAGLKIQHRVLTEERCNALLVDTRWALSRL